MSRLQNASWRLYSDYLRSESREDAEKVLRRAADISVDHVLRLAGYFGGDFGRLPDDLHNMVVLTGGPLSVKYVERLDGGLKEA